MASTNVPQYRPVSGPGAIKLRDRAEELKYKQEVEGLKAKRKADDEKNKASAEYVGKSIPGGTAKVLTQDQPNYSAVRNENLRRIQSVLTGQSGDVVARVLSNRQVGRQLRPDESEAVSIATRALEALRNVDRTAELRYEDAKLAREYKNKGAGVFLTPYIKSILDAKAPTVFADIESGLPTDARDVASQISVGTNLQPEIKSIQDVMSDFYGPKLRDDSLLKRTNLAGDGQNVNTEFAYRQVVDKEKARRFSEDYVRRLKSSPNLLSAFQEVYGEKDEEILKAIMDLAPGADKITYESENSGRPSAAGAAEQKALSGVSLAATPQSDSRGNRLSEGLTRALPKTIAIGRSAGIPGSDDDTTLEGARSYNRIAGSESGRIFTNEEFKSLIDQNLAEGKPPLFGFNSIVAARGTVGKNISVPAAGWNALTPEQRTEIVINDPTKLAEWNRRFPGVPLSPENARAKESLEGVTAILQALTPPKPDQPIKIVSTDIVDTQFPDANEAKALGLPLPNTSFINLQDLATKYPAALKKMYSGGDGTPSETLRIIEDALARYKQGPRTATPAQRPAAAPISGKKRPLSGPPK